MLREAPDVNTRPAAAGEESGRRLRAEQPEQGGPSQNLAVGREQGGEAVRVGSAGRSRCGEPGGVGEGSRADRLSRAGDRPGAEGLAQGGRLGPPRDREAEAEAGKAVGLSEGTQHDRRRRQVRDEARGRHEIRKGLVDDEEAAPPCKACPSAARRAGGTIGRRGCSG